MQNLDGISKLYENNLYLTEKAISIFFRGLYRDPVILKSDI